MRDYHTRFNVLNLDEMLLKCRDEAARQLMNEAVTAYHSSAYRSAIISTWVAVFIDLASKIRSLSLAGDEKAIAWIAKYDKYIELYDPNQPSSVVPLQKLEGTILNTAKNDFQLLSALDLVDLKRLREDRHRCAHPAMKTSSELFSPNAEQARAHIRAGLEHVLLKPAIRGDVAVDRILETILDEGFPSDINQVTEVLRSFAVLDLDTNSFARLVSKISRTLFDQEADNNSRIRFLTTLTSLHNLFPSWFDSHYQSFLSEHLEGQNLWVWTVLIEMTQKQPWVTSYIGPIQSGRLNAYVRSLDAHDYDDAKFLVKCMETQITRHEALGRIDDIPNHLMSLLSKSIPKDLILIEGVRRLEMSESWNDTYGISEKLIIPNAHLLDKAQITKIRNAISNNANVKGSYILESLILTLLLLNDPDRLGRQEIWSALIGSCKKLDEVQKQSLQSYVDNAYSDNPIPF